MKGKIRFLLQGWKISPTLFIFYVFSLGLFEINAKGIYRATIFFYDYLALVFVGLLFTNALLARITKKIFRVKS